MYFTRRSPFALIATLFLLVLAGPAFADSVGVQFVGVGSQNQNGVFTYPYYISLDRGAEMAMVCDDFYDRIDVGDHWQAVVTDLTSGDVSKTMFRDLTKYREAAYLFLQIKSYNSDQWGNINWAIWTLFDPGIDPGYQYKDGVEFWLNQAETADLSKVDFSGIHILTPTRPGPQEFIYITPEPGTLLLFGSGLLGVCAARKRRR